MSVNPYEPPQSTPTVPQAYSVETLATDGPIHFSGQLDRMGLDRFLRAYDNVGCTTMFLACALMALALLWARLIGSPAATMIVLGIMGIVVIACAVSTLTYRRAMFRSANRNWGEFVKGEIRVDGVSIERHNATMFLSWTCFADVVVGTGIVAFLPGLKYGETIVISEPMLSEPGDFYRLTGVAKSVRRQMVTGGSLEQRRFALESVVKEPGRQRSIAVPHDAMAFAGFVSGDDLRSVPRRAIQPRRTLRTIIVQVSLVISIWLIVFGLLVALNLFDVFPTTRFVLFVLLPIGLLIAFLVRRLRVRRILSEDHVIQYLLAFANESGITSDTSVAVTHYPWHQVKSLLKTTNRITLLHVASRKFLIARRDMFSDDDAWQKFMTLAERKLAENAV